MKKIDLNKATHNELVDYIVDYYNEHFKWQKLIYDEYIDRNLVDKMTDKYLRNFIKENCKN